MERSSGERGWRNCPGGPGDALGVAVRPDRCDLEGARALDDEGARPHLVAGRRARPAAPHPSGSTRPRTGRRSARSGPSATTWSPGAEPDEIALDDLRHVEPARLAVPDDGGARRHERRELVELPLGPELLPDPDPGVGDDDPEKERVAPVAEDQRQEPEREQDRVERRHGVRADDCRRRPARGRLRRLAAGGKTRRSLRLGQA